MQLVGHLLGHGGGGVELVTQQQCGADAVTDDRLEVPGVGAAKSAQGMVYWDMKLMPKRYVI